MPSIADATAQILAAPAPVLLIDTCSLLDIIRAPKRALKLKGCIKNAVELRRRIKAAPPECHLAVGSFVPAEWAKHADTIRDELQRHLKSLDEASSHFHDACGHVGIATGARPSFEPSQLPATLHRLSSDLLKHAIQLDAQDDTNMKAYTRAANNVPPSIKGGEIKDSTILEECLEVCRNLRKAGFADKLVYCTSNTTDYCQAGNNLHTQILADFSPLDVRFVTSLPWAVSELEVRVTTKQKRQFRVHRCSTPPTPTPS
jgi:hypothetical protein